jgi:DNA excision repair protein ERCC-1
VVRVAVATMAFFFVLREDCAGSKRGARAVPSEFLDHLRENMTGSATAAATIVDTTAAVAAAEGAPASVSAPAASSASASTTPTLGLAASSTPVPPLTTFKDAFSSLRASEFYQPPTLSTPSAMTNSAGNTTTSIVAGRGSGNAILVYKSQQGNPLLKRIRNVPYELCGDLVSDFQLGASTCAIFLSLNFHRRYPEYIHGRIRELGKQYRLRVLLVLSDQSDNQASLVELTKLAMTFDLTMLVAWSNDEAARYLETFKMYEHKSADQLQERKTDDYLGLVSSCLTTVKSVNKSDAVTLLSTFCSLRGIVEADPDEVRLCPGFGENKA